MASRPPFPFGLLLRQLNIENRERYRRAMKGIMKLPIQQQVSAMEHLVEKLYRKQKDDAAVIRMCTPSRDYENGL